MFSAMMQYGGCNCRLSFSARLPADAPCLCRQDRKDKEKDKRVRGQSTHANWKSEVGLRPRWNVGMCTAHLVAAGLGLHHVACLFALLQAEMVLRQQYD